MNKDGYCSIQYPIHLVCLIKINHKQGKVYIIMCAQLCVLYKEQNSTHELFMFVCLFDGV